MASSVLKIVFDEHCLLFQDGKMLSRLLVCRANCDPMMFETVLLFNQIRRSPRLVELCLDEAHEFARELVNAVYYAKTPPSCSKRPCG
ncbi:hypothetical protein Mnod_2559 [Methylobacterium nodulans ORS 2060]|uniref:Uncharacterized protein n=1 Tax=Methylobacterium nodulans (strain LMG 21967 / CNCM I-2342 / ORS 2060) TaxID=460265 RepID=B8ICW2_METNO|nr:hypothetical protein Mnod_2559 [Methylobacterium nodulans ORS 2060]